MNKGAARVALGVAVAGSFLLGMNIGPSSAEVERQAAVVAPQVIPAGAHARCVQDTDQLDASADLCEGLDDGKPIAEWRTATIAAGWTAAPDDLEMDGPTATVPGKGCLIYTDDTTFLLCPDGRVGTS